ncbi:MAG: mechanosensitive ion channel domain-containing protein [Pseudomonadota bacterium]
MIEAARDTLSEIWVITVEVWRASLFGLDVGQILAALGVLLIAFVFRGLFSHFLHGVIKAQAAKTETEIDDKILEAISSPLKLIPIIIGMYIAVQILGLNGSADNPGAGIFLVQSLIALAIFWALHNAVEPVAHLLEPLRRALTPVLVDWLAKTLRVVFVVLGVAAVLQIWGIPVAPIIAGFGLFGVAIGLGAQDLFKNLIAGLLILTEKRFLPGDWIKVDGIVEGTVEKINFRSTLVRRFDKGPVYVPNAFLADNAVTNFSRMTHRRIKWAIGVEYKTTTEQLQYIRDEVLNYILTNPEFAKPPEVATFMRVDAFGPSSIDFLLYSFTRTTNWGEWLRLKEELAFAIKRIVEEEAGTSFAFPSTTVYVDEGAEVFLPPEGREKLTKLIEARENQTRIASRDGGDAGEGG